MAESFISQKIADVMTPFVGQIMAQSILKVQCKRMNIDPDKLTIIDLPRISATFSAHMDLFVGTDKAQEIARRLMQITL